MAGSIIASNVPSYQVLLAHLQTALTNPLVERCLMLTQLLLDSPLKELQYVFPALVENVFGFRTGVDWGLLSLDRNVQAREFDHLRRLLSSEGPLLRLALKFTEESSPKFEFPVACLPLPTQLLLQEGKVPPLYANKLQIGNPGFFPTSLQLNAFEFYLFHFTYFIVNSAVKNSTSAVNQQDTLYAHILEDYLMSFLPTDNRAVPLFQAPSNAQHSPILSSSLSSSFGNAHHVSSDHLGVRGLPSRPDFLSSPSGKQQGRPSLLKKGALVMVSSGGSNPSHGSPAESWRSETFVLILREVLLGQNSMEQQQKNSNLLIPKTFIASHYHVWMVRIMVKHLHFFFNSTLAPNQSTGHGQIMIDSLGRLKSLGMTQLIQKEIYCFLKSTFDHWPLDASFRVPLETYLSYIQPWRYTHLDFEPSVWQKFMTENLLFYTTIFQQILRRFLRMDLSCPKNAYMLFRLTKVMCSAELREMIMQAEKGSSLSKPSSLGMSPYLHHSPEKFALHKHSSQLEGYPPLFSEPVFLLVTHLLSSITAAREKTSVQSPSCGNTSKGFLSRVCGFFETSDDAVNSDDNSPSDVRKVASYLESSSNQLCNFFREVIPPTLNFSRPAASPSMNNNNDPLCAANNLHCLSMSDRVQLLSRKRRPEVTYRGNPDLQPIRTYEVGFLVNRLNDVSQHLNDTYASEMEELYGRNSIVGKVCRKLLLEPVTYYDIQKSKDMQSVSMIPVHLPPRVSLRVLAHKQLIGYFALYMLLGYFFNYNPVVSFVSLVGLLLLGFLVSVLWRPVPFPDKDD